MLNLKVFDQAGTPYYLDLYESEPLKLNFSIEDIENTDAKSTFSRIFRVPSTTKNNEFFKMAFLIEGIDFDVTVKVPAEIEVGGALFRSGHIRLQNIFRNEEQDRIDYEILYMGETRDFSGIIGELTLCELDGTSLIHGLTYTNITTSWNAFPASTSGNSGLLGGDVLYPLADHGNTYVGTTPQEPEIRTVGTVPFTNVLNPLTIDRFKPMIRARKIIDLIFEQTPYTFSSSFINSLFFGKIYVSAWGNDDSIFTQTNQSEQLFQAVFPGIFGFSGGANPQRIDCFQEVYDPGGNYNNQPFPAPGFSYEAPLAGVYEFTGSGYINATPNPNTGLAYGCIEIHVNGSSVATGTCATGGQADVQVAVSLNPGDYVQLFVDWTINTDYGFIEDATFTCIGAPGDLEPTFLLDCEYKQIDFLRDILKLFRCVMAPDITNPNNFIIEPWIDYVTSGETYDWSSKVDRTKDFQIEPLFYTQADEITFKFTEDQDFINKFNQDAYKQVYGELIFDSGNELLKGTRNITVGFAPTPMSQIEGEPNTSTWIIPKPHIHETEGSATLHVPIKPVTRILFYNGKVNTPVNWFLTDDVTTFTQTLFPYVSYQEGVPPATQGLNINWDRWFAYYGTNVSGYNGLLGQSLYERFWSGYINSLYNKFARRVTCNIILNSVDLQDFSFNDVVYIDGVYYIAEKIIDAPIGERASVKVQLLKLLDYRPPNPAFPPIEFYYYLVQETDCDALTGPLFVIQSSTPLTLGDYIKAQGTTTCYQVISPSSGTIWDLIFENTWNDCITCLGATTSFVYYVEQYSTCATTFSPGLTVSAGGSLFIGDTVGLTNNPGCWKVIGISFLAPVDTVAVVFIDCPACISIGEAAIYLLTNCLDPGDTVVATSPTTLAIGSAVTIIGNPACWTVSGYSPAAPTETIDVQFVDCNDCLETNPQEYVYDLETCSGGEFTIGVYNLPLTPGQAVNVDALPGCWEVIALSVNPPFVNILSVYVDCATCQVLDPVE